MRRDRTGPTGRSTDPRWRRYGIHWHLFVRRHELADRARSAGFVDEHYRSAAPDEVGYSPAEVVDWQRGQIRAALRGATGTWADARRQGLDDLDGDWARALHAQLDRGLSSVRTIRTSDTEVTELTAYAIGFAACTRHQAR